MADGTRPRPAAARRLRFDLGVTRKDVELSWVRPSAAASGLLGGALAVSGVILAARVWGPLSFPVSVVSPLNVESIFALAGLLLLAFRANGGGPPETSRQRNWAVPVTSLLLLIAAAYYRTLNLYFLSDDFLHLTYAPVELQHPGVLFTMVGSDRFYRPLGYLSMGINSIWAGSDPFGWHLPSLVLHAANTVLVFHLARTLKLDHFAAWFAAALFAIHGTRPEAVVWLAARFDLLATFFVLVGLLAFLRGWHWIALVAMALGVLSKESAYAFPLLVVVLLLARRRPIRECLPYFGLAAAFFAFRWLLFHGIGGYDGGKLGLLASARALMLRMWAILFFPINWSVPPGAALAILAATYLGCLAWLFTSKVPRRLLAVSLGLVLAGAAPAVQQLLIGADLQKSRVLYLPSIGFCLLIAVAVQHLNPRTRWATATAVLVFQAATLWHNTDAWVEASRQAETVCAAAATGQMPDTPPPGSLNGVYFFANGFKECVELRRATKSPSRP